MRQADLSLASPVRLRRAEQGWPHPSCPTPEPGTDPRFSCLNSPSPGCQAGTARGPRDPAEPPQIQEAGGPYL